MQYYYLLVSHISTALAYLAYLAYLVLIFIRNNHEIHLYMYVQSNAILSGQRCEIFGKRSIAGHYFKHFIHLH